MTLPPIFHITSIENLPSILADGCLWSDTQRIRRDMTCKLIGYEHIKTRRRRRPITAGAHGVLGDYVPFYFCPRSVMLHSIWRGLVTTYDGGQEAVVHLVSTVAAAVGTQRPWASTNLHAELAEADCYDDLNRLDQLRWNIIRSNSWGGDERRKYKQAEFLIHDWCPFDVFTEIGVISDEWAEKVQAILRNFAYSPLVRVHRNWYY